MASSNAVEVAVLRLNDDKVTWTLLTLEDAARINLPMVKAEESYPVGIAIDYSFPIQTPVGRFFVIVKTFFIISSSVLMNFVFQVTDWFRCQYYQY